MFCYTRELIATVDILALQAVILLKKQNNQTIFLLNETQGWNHIPRKLILVSQLLLILNTLMIFGVFIK